MVIDSKSTYFLSTHDRAQAPWANLPSIRTSTLPVLSTQGDEQEEGGATTVLGRRFERPKLYKVFLHNDDYTTMEFVILVLQNVFLKNFEEANHIMLKIHNEGIGLCGVYTHEIAETKVSKATQMAKDNGHPLKCTMEAQ